MMEGKKKKKKRAFAHTQRGNDEACARAVARVGETRREKSGDASFSVVARSARAWLLSDKQREH